jgi:hypothetical protein
MREREDAAANPSAFSPKRHPPVEAHPVLRSIKNGLEQTSWLKARLKGRNLLVVATDAARYILSFL